MSSMFTKALLVGVILTVSIVYSEERKVKRLNSRLEELKETLENEENPEFMAVAKMDTRRKREMKRDLLELEKLMRIYPVSEESDKKTKREEIEKEIRKAGEIVSKRERPHRKLEGEETAERQVREEEENAEKEIRAIEAEKKHREIEEEKATKREESELSEEETAKREESKHNEIRREEELENEEESENKMKRTREFELLNDPGSEETPELIARRGFPKWMKDISRQFPGNTNQVRCALKQMQAARKSMRKYKIKNCDRYFRCRGSRDVVTKCGGYSIAVAVLVSKSKQWRTGGADKKYEYGPDIYGRHKGNCVQKYIYDTIATKRPCHLPYVLFK